MKHAKTILALLLALLMTAGVLAACANGNKPSGPVTNGTGNGGTDTAPGSGTETEAVPNLPDTTFNGQTITSVSSEGWEFVLEDDPNNQEALSAAKYRAGAIVAEKFDVKLASWNDPEHNSGQLAVRVAESAMAGDFDYDYVFPHPIYGQTEMIVQNLLTDINTLKYVDLEKPWWNKKGSEQLAVRGKSYWVWGDLCVDRVALGLFVANKDLLRDIGYNKDLYEVVFDGNWTCDEILAINALAVKDLNGDQTIDPEHDQYGLVLQPAYSFHVFAMGQRLTEINSDGLPEFVVNTPHMIEVVEKFTKMVYDNGTYFEMWNNAALPSSPYYKIMKEGRAAIMNLDIGLSNLIRALDYDYMLLPMAKYDDKQEDYVEFAGTGLLGVCATDRPTDCADAVLEALSYEYYKLVRPAYYNVVLDQKIAQDENSQKILDLMFDSITYDPGINYEQTCTADEILLTIAITRKGQGAASYLKKIEGKLDTLMEDLYETLYNR